MIGAGGPQRKFLQIRTFFPSAGPTKPWRRRSLVAHSGPDKGVLSLPDEAEALAPRSDDVLEGLQQAFLDGSDALLTWPRWHLGSLRWRRVQRADKARATPCRRGAARAAAGRGGSPRRVLRGPLASPLGAAGGSVSPVLRRHPPAVPPTGTACGPSRPHRTRASPSPPPLPRPPVYRGCTTRAGALFHCCRRRAGGNRH